MASPKPEHSSFSLTEGEVGILGQVVHMATDLLAVDIPDVLHSGAV